MPCSSPSWTALPATTAGSTTAIGGCRLDRMTVRKFGSAKIVAIVAVENQSGCVRAAAASSPRTNAPWPLFSSMVGLFFFLGLDLLCSVHGLGRPWGVSRGYPRMSQKRNMVTHDSRTGGRIEENRVKTLLKY